jgi:predicted ribosomally synthesized six-cysteine peptide SCIFF
MPLFKLRMLCFLSEKSGFLYLDAVAPAPLIIYNVLEEGVVTIGKHIKTVNKTQLSNVKERGCGECQTSCQSACKTSCTVGNQVCSKEHSE